jgi:hypothetical protein
MPLRPALIIVDKTLMSRACTGSPRSGSLNAVHCGGIVRFVTNSAAFLKCARNEARLTKIQNESVEVLRKGQRIQAA